MIVINQIRTELVFDSDSRKLSMQDLLDDEKVLRKKAAKILGVRETELSKVCILKHSIDARKKPQLLQVYTLGVSLQNRQQEEKAVRRCKNNQVALYAEQPYVFPVHKESSAIADNPVIIGMGPAGLFCGYMLAKHGFKPIILERGYDVETRTKDVEAFWRGGKLNPESNVQFGEGGAGTFSDGKLNTLVKDKQGRNKEVLRIFVENGAPEQILYESKPHIGTDILKKVVANMRQFIIENGGRVRFGAKVTEFKITQQLKRQISAVIVNDTDVINTSFCVLAIGHSARDTYAYLEDIHISMEAKAFAVGMRVEHPQSLINAYMYGNTHGQKLPAAPYKLTAQTSTGRGVYSFCMCPGGYVVNASSEHGRLAVNGMSYADRAGSNANSAIIVQVTPEDYPDKGALAGIEFQRRLEEKAYALGKGKVPVQYYGDFVNNISSEEDNSVGQHAVHKPSIKGEYAFANLRGLLPEDCEKAFLEGMAQFDKTIHGFAAEDTVLAGIESRTSSPVRIHRDDTLQSPSLRGLYPCGEGAGYAGGIISAAMDGMLVAEQIARVWEKRIGGE